MAHVYVMRDVYASRPPGGTSCTPGWSAAMPGRLTYLLWSRDSPADFRSRSQSVNYGDRCCFYRTRLDTTWLFWHERSANRLQNVKQQNKDGNRLSLNNDLLEKIQYRCWAAVIVRRCDWPSCVWDETIDAIVWESIYLSKNHTRFTGSCSGNENRAQRLMANPNISQFTNYQSKLKTDVQYLMFSNIRQYELKKKKQKIEAHGKQWLFEVSHYRIKTGILWFPAPSCIQTAPSSDTPSQ